MLTWRCSSNLNSNSSMQRKFIKRFNKWIRLVLTRIWVESNSSEPSRFDSTRIRTGVADRSFEQLILLQFNVNSKHKILWYIDESVTIGSHKMTPQTWTSTVFLILLMKFSNRTSTVIPRMRNSYSHYFGSATIKPYRPFMESVQWSRNNQIIISSHRGWARKHTKRALC